MFLEVNGGRLRTVDLGRGARTFLAHGGWTGDWQLWQQPFEQLSRSWRTVSYDHRGSGQSPVAKDRLTFDGLVDDLLAVMDALGIERCVLAGESSGTLVAQAAALRAPERFDALVLVAGMARWVYGPAERAFVGGLRIAPPLAVRGFVRLALPERGAGHVRRWGRHIINQSTRAARPRLLTLLAGVDHRAALPGLAVPTLVIHGTRDLIVSPGRSKELAALLPDSELHLLPGAGHVPTLTRPEEVTDLIEDFLARRLPVNPS